MSEYVAPPPQFASSPYGAQQAFGQQPPRMSALAVVSLILGIIIPVGGIILGPIAMRHTRRYGFAGYSLAKAGFVIGLCLFILGLIVGLLATWYFGGIVFSCAAYGIGCSVPIPPTVG